MSAVARGLERLADATVALSFGVAGYHLRKPGFRQADTDVDMSGQVVVVTGANSGIGFETASALALRGALVMMVCRSEERGARAAERIVALHPAAQVEVLRCDVSELDDVRELAQQLKARTQRVDRLILNAGVLLDDRQETSAGLERTFATNVLGAFLLTGLLEQELAAAPDGRVLHVTSGGMYTQRINLELLQGLSDPFDGVVAYAQTKRAQVILNEMWAKRLARSGIVSHAMHPGWADTPGVATSLPRFHKLMGPMLRTPAQGADTLVWLATAPGIGDRTGELWLDRSPQPTHKMQRTREDQQDREALWSLCERLSSDG